jgi:flagellar basal body P-ring formation protein FlgA
MSCKPPKCRRLLLSACLLAFGAQAAVVQDLGELETVVTAEAQRLLPPLTDKQRLVVGPLPAQLQLARCETPIQSAKAAGFQAPGRVLIELRCNGQTPWHLYVPARVVGTGTVVLTAHALIAGTVLAEKDLVTEEKDLIGLPPGYLNDPSIAVGLTAGRAIAGGTILTNQQLLGAQAVQRGQTVTLIADAGGISVRMEGRALSDGFINQRVRVENLSSGKIVEGIARSPQLVEIIF